MYRCKQPVKLTCEICVAQSSWSAQPATSVQSDMGELILPQEPLMCQISTALWVSMVSSESNPD